MKTELIREALESVGRIRLTVGGRSMWPFIPDRSVVVIRRVLPGQVQVGDVAMVWTGPERFLLQVLRSLVTHGILRSARGVDGGYSLTRPPEEVSVLEVIEAIDRADALSSHAGIVWGEQETEQ